ncbi:EB module [Teladorsagia circumcincta]|uniref:EB module n=1 Tax=Teladorsagia circumcincta TaxID=45464 RepID=A0A2G9UK01_TELCI|nr:EB module [Teladorsagia circumcincta]
MVGHPFGIIRAWSRSVLVKRIVPAPTNAVLLLLDTVRLIDAVLLEHTCAVYLLNRERSAERISCRGTTSTSSPANAHSSSLEAVTATTTTSSPLSSVGASATVAHVQQAMLLTSTRIRRCQSIATRLSVTVVRTDTPAPSTPSLIAMFAVEHLIKGRALPVNSCTKIFTHPCPHAVLWDEVISARTATPVRAIYQILHRVSAVPAMCCGVSGGCPNDSVAFVGLSGEPERCVAGQSKCPVGFACQRSSGNHHICCATKQECGPEQVKHGNVCYNRADLGKPCVTSEQCPDQGVCTDGICVCNERTVNLNGKCASPMARAKIVQSKSGASKCSNANSKALFSPETARVVFCSPKAKQCPHGYSCQINTKRTQYICCSTAELTSQAAASVCPSGRVPYLINGLPQRCTKQRCPRGYECTYKDHDYLCCSSAGKISGKQQSSTSTAGPTGVVEQCPRGNPLIYPSTRLPVVCTPGKKSCPIG